MKMSRLCMLGLAGLAFTACSNEDVTESQFPQGKGAVSIKIVAPEMSRTADATTGTDAVTVEPQGDVTITLNATTGGSTITLSPQEWAAGKTVTFWNVEAPQSVTVSMNGGVASYDAINIHNGTPSLQVLPEAIPVYGTTSSFTATDRSESPDLNDTTYETGAGAGDDTKKYQIWTATVQLEIPVARLEVSGITHVHTLPGDAASCKYAILTIDGVYLDNVKPTDAGNRTDYQFISEEDGGTGTGVEAILKEAINGTPSFLDGSTWPAVTEPAKAYAFNFYGPSETEISSASTSEAKQALNPKFKIYFASATGSSQEVTQPRYAMITKYTKDGEDIILQNGMIYRITKAELTDENIIGDENGNTLYGVEVEVEEATWTPVDITAEWAK